MESGDAVPALLWIRTEWFDAAPAWLLALDWRRTANATAWNAMINHAKISRFRMKDDEKEDGSEEFERSSREPRESELRCTTMRGSLDEDSMSIFEKVFLIKVRRKRNDLPLLVSITEPS